MTDTRDGDIPILWLSLEYAAETLVTRAYGRVSNATFQYRAARDVLALSLLLSGHTASTPSENGLKSIRSHLVDGSQWCEWCSSQLESVLAELSTADRDLARNAWRWLTGSWMLIDSTSSFPCACSTAKGCQVGVEQARQIVNAVLALKQ
ncbi:hypothetical protein AB0L13_33200 [Saccharopolyspora shandongensis]|uniref:hypothetical protein n=1 Tax=Saccharopolyspora shandongensis TaxID=418495 RepID=UPI0034172394